MSPLVAVEDDVSAVSARAKEGVGLLPPLLPRRAHSWQFHFHPFNAFSHSFLSSSPPFLMPRHNVFLAISPVHSLPAPPPPELHNRAPLYLWRSLFTFSCYIFLLALFSAPILSIKPERLHHNASLETPSDSKISRLNRQSIA